MAGIDILNADFLKFLDKRSDNGTKRGFKPKGYSKDSEDVQLQK